MVVSRGRPLCRQGHLAAAPAGTFCSSLNPSPQRSCSPTRLRFCGSTAGLMGVSLADRRTPLSSALQAETPEYMMDHVVSCPPLPPDAASPQHGCCCCLVIYEFPAPSLLLSHGTPPPHPHLPLSSRAAAGKIDYLFLRNKYFALTPVPLPPELWPAATSGSVPAAGQRSGCS